MSERKIDRDAWADLIRTLVLSESRGKKAAFSRLIGVSTRTLDRWLATQVDVSEGSVRAVARALERPAAELLVAVGYYRPDEVLSSAPPAVAPVDDELRDIAQRADLDEDTKVEIIQLLIKRREDDRRRRAEDIEWLITQRRQQRGPA